MKVIQAFTDEVNDVDIAVNQVLGQIYTSELLENSLGILACHYEFVLSGVADAICEALPFNVVGTVSSAQATDAAFGKFGLALTILTANDVMFSTALSEPLDTNPEIVAAQAYATAAASEDAIVGANPQLVLLHAPYMLTNSGDDYLDAINKESGGVPLFGAIGADDTSDFRYCYSIYNGECFNNRIALTLVYGNVSPCFYVASVGKINDSFNKEDMLVATSKAMDAALNNYVEKKTNATSIMLVYSCIAQNISLCSDQLLEPMLVKEKLAGKLPFMMANAYGEFCPTQNNDDAKTASGLINNRFHNNTLSVCVL
ncbi:MAG: hypothetical protein LBG97_08080 [Coriobacteriales bacterium]|jgi:hypothetical protein|nr:hypothetical protein [Coriobacteriales bacterium]